MQCDARDPGPLKGAPYRLGWPTRCRGVWVASRLLFAAWRRQGLREATQATAMGDTPLPWNKEAVPL